MLLVTENAPADRRGFYGGFAQAGAPMGVVLANLAFLAVTASVSEEAFMSWGWRIPFIASLLLVGLALYVQLRLEDTPAFNHVVREVMQHLSDFAKVTSDDMARLVESWNEKASRIARAVRFSCV